MTFKIGNTVNYHSIIGGTVTSEGHEITDIIMSPNDFGCDVAWITKKRGCVALEALSNEENPIKEKPKPLTRSQQRYQDYLHSEVSCSFAEWLGVAS